MNKSYVHIVKFCFLGAGHAEDLALATNRHCIVNCYVNEIDAYNKACTENTNLLHHCDLPCKLMMLNEIYEDILFDALFNESLKKFCLKHIRLQHELERYEGDTMLVNNFLNNRCIYCNYVHLENAYIDLPNNTSLEELKKMNHNLVNAIKAVGAGNSFEIYCVVQKCVVY